MMNQAMIEQLTEQEYSFFLSYGVSDDAQLQEQELLDLLEHEQEWELFIMYLHEHYPIRTMLKVL